MKTFEGQAIIAEKVSGVARSVLGIELAMQHADEERLISAVELRRMLALAFDLGREHERTGT